ncbi:MAG: hypothetical protein QXK76_03660, partial [Candidatus Woesearchaeota archaeon]
MFLFKSSQKQLNARLIKHLNDLAKAGLDISTFDKKKILGLEEVDVQLIQDINELHRNNITQYDKIYPHLQTLRLDLEKVLNKPELFTDSEKQKIKELVNGIITIIQESQKNISETKKVRIKQLISWGFIDEDSELTELLITYWT